MEVYQLTQAQPWADGITRVGAYLVNEAGQVRAFYLHLTEEGYRWRSWRSNRWWEVPPVEVRLAPDVSAAIPIGLLGKVSPSRILERIKKHLNPK